MATFDQRQQVVTTQYNIAQGISEEQYQRLAEELGVTRAALTNFFKNLEQQQVPPEDLDHTLRQIATSYKELHAKSQHSASDDPAVGALKSQARDAVEAGEFARAEALLNAASEDERFRRNRRQMLAKVRLIWIKGLLEPSLAPLARLELGLKTQPDALEHPFDLLVQRPKQAPQRLPPGTPISQIFQDSGNALLILGRPGAGKTTLLLELTRELLDRAAQDEHHLIPVVFHLSSWAEQQFALADWLVDELNKRYDVPPERAKTWVDAGLILPLLDGLDEVAPDRREACVEAINTFLNQGNKQDLLPLVVCSRVADYKALTGRLRLSSAVRIRSLSRQQVRQYVEQAGASLAGLRTVLQDDKRLWKLLTTPLMLSIAASAYQGRSADAIPSSGTVDEHRAHLFAAYTDAMFQRRAKATPYTRAQTEHWLTWLARAMKSHNQSMFYLEWMQPDWLPGQRQQWLITFVLLVIGGLLYGLVYGGLYGLVYTLRGGLGFGLEAGLVSGLSFGLLGGISVGIRSLLIGGLLAGLGAGLVYTLHGGLGAGLEFGPPFGLLGGISVGVIGYTKEIKPVEKLRWSWSEARYKWIRRLFKRLRSTQLYMLPIGLLIGLLRMLLGGPLSGPSSAEWLDESVGFLLGITASGLAIGLGFGLLCGLYDGFTVGEIGTQTFPNEGIRRSMRNAAISGLLSALLCGLFFTLLSGLFFGLSYGLLAGLFFGPVFGLVSGLRFGGRASLDHFALRLVLWYNNFAPLNYIRFLDYATTRIFLRRVGGGYVFVHRMLLEYFAARHQASAERHN